MFVPTEPKIYHIAHVDRLASIVEDGALWCDATMSERSGTGTTIGMSSIKRRRLTNPLNSHRNLRVGDCVPFYFCPRSTMLYVIHMSNHPELDYRGGQGLIVHLEADLRNSVAWADANHKRWAFTPSNAGASYFEDYMNLRQLDKVDWAAVQANRWSGAGVDGSVKEGKQAEFLIESSFPWKLVLRIGVHSRQTRDMVLRAVQASYHQPPVEIKPDWYY